MTTKVYNPKHVCTDSELTGLSKGQTQDTYARLDSLHHYFIDGDEFVYDECDDHVIEVGEVLAKLIGGVYGNHRVLRHVMPHDAPDFSLIRDHASFIGGELVSGWIPQFRNWLGYHMNGNYGDERLIIDAIDYMQDTTEDQPTPAFNQLMILADDTKGVIDRALVDTYRHDGRGLMQFINSPEDRMIEEPSDSDSGCEEDVCPDEPISMTKWMWESKFLADELIKIPEFRCNFHTLVILNAQKHIHTGHLNLTKLYRLFAKLGRVNTRLVFLG